MMLRAVPMVFPVESASLWRRAWVGVLLAALGWGGGLGTAVQAQPAEADSTHTLILRDVPLRQALDELVAATQVNLIYDSGLVRDQRIFCTGRDAPPEALLRCILHDVPLDYVRTSSGTFVLIASVQRAPRRGQLAGRVVDEETGEPLPHAHVLLADASTGTATNEAGLFSFSSLLSGSHRVVVTYMGYRTHVEQVWVPPNESVRARIALHPRPMSTDPVVVTGLQQRLPSKGLGKGEFDAGRVSAPGGMGTPDVTRGAGRLMGVSRRSPLAELHIQGGGTGEHQVQLDGIPVRNPVSLGRLLGAFSPLAIGRFTVHKAGFGAQHGSHLAGLVEVEHDLTRSGDRYASVEVDPVSINGRVQHAVRLPGGVAGDAMIAARSSTWDVYRDPALHELLTEWNTADAFLASQLVGREIRAADLEPHRSQIGVSFSDVHAATRLQLGPFHSLYASLYRGTNEIGAGFQTVPAEPSDSARAVVTRDHYDWSNLGGQIRLEWLLGARAIGTVRLHGSRHASRYEYRAGATAPPGPEVPDENNEVNEVGVEAALEYSLTAQHRVIGALEAVHTDSRFRADNGFIRPLAYANPSWHLASYVTGEHALGMQATLEWGTRLTFVPERRTVYAEPRLALRYDRSESALGAYAVRIASGLYRQFTSRFDLSSTGPTSVVPSIRFWLPIDASTAPPTAYHAAADLLLMPAPRWTISAEGYYKGQPRIHTLDYATLVAPSEAPTLQTATQRDFVTASRGYAYGAGLQVTYDGPRLQSALRYTHSHSRRQYPSRFGDGMEATPWNEPHRLALDLDVPVVGGLAAHGSWKAVWGRSWAFRRAYYDYLSVGVPTATFGDYAIEAPASHTLSPLYRLDAGLSYTRNWGSVHVTAQAHLINVLDRANAFDWRLSPTDTGLDRGVRTLPGRRPVLSLTVGY